MGVDEIGCLALETLAQSLYLEGEPGLLIHLEGRLLSFLCPAEEAPLAPTSPVAVEAAYWLDSRAVASQSARSVAEPAAEALADQKIPGPTETSPRTSFRSGRFWHTLSCASTRGAECRGSMARPVYPALPDDPSAGQPFPPRGRSFSPSPLPRDEPSGLSPRVFHIGR
jgi:hypothetical protein